jgi:hypothetical protein
MWHGSGFYPEFSDLHLDKFGTPALPWVCELGVTSGTVFKKMIKLLAGEAPVSHSHENSPDAVSPWRWQRAPRTPSIKKR